MQPPHLRLCGFLWVWAEYPHVHICFFSMFQHGTCVAPPVVACQLLLLATARCQIHENSVSLQQSGAGTIASSDLRLSSTASGPNILVAKEALPMHHQRPFPGNSR
jgi:hypothetical protein